MPDIEKINLFLEVGLQLPAGQSKSVRFWPVTQVLYGHLSPWQLMMPVAFWLIGVMSTWRGESGTTSDGKHHVTDSITMVIL